MTKEEKLKRLKETNIEAYKAAREKINHAERLRRKKLKEQNPELYYKKLARQRENSKLHYMRVKIAYPDKYKHYLSYQKQYYNNNYSPNMNKNPLRTVTTSEKTLGYEKLLDEDVTYDFIKNLVKKTQAPIVVNESKKIVERALNAYNY